MVKDYKTSALNLIVKLIENSGMTNTAFAERLGVDRTQLLKWKRGATQPLVPLLYKISEVLEIRIVIDERKKKKPRPLSEMTNAEFHRFFKSTKEAGFSQEDIRLMKLKLTDKKSLFLMLYHFGRENAYEDMEDQLFDLQFKTK